MRQIIENIRQAWNDPDRKLNNCSPLEQELRELEKYLQDNSNNRNKTHED